MAVRTQELQATNQRLISGYASDEHAPPAGAVDLVLLRKSFTASELHLALDALFL